jgi:hypothetical protein
MTKVKYKTPYWGDKDYRIGTDGSFWSKKRGNVWKKRKQSPNCLRYGRPGVSVIIKGKMHFLLISHIVLRTFVGSCPPGMECCHFPDGDVTNNNLSNLRWDTRKNNFKDRDIHGTTARGEKVASSKLTKREVLAIRRLYTPGKGSEWTASKLAAKYNVDTSLIYMIVNRKTWRHIP